MYKGFKVTASSAALGIDIDHDQAVFDDLLYEVLSDFVAELIDIGHAEHDQVSLHPDGDRA